MRCPYKQRVWSFFSIYYTRQQFRDSFLSICDSKSHESYTSCQKPRLRPHAIDYSHFDSLLTVPEIAFHLSAETLMSERLLKKKLPGACRKAFF